MRPSSRRCVLGLTTSLVIAALSSAIAQEQTSLISTVLTGKERLGRKWMDALEGFLPNGRVVTGAQDRAGFSEPGPGMQRVGGVCHSKSSCNWGHALPTMIRDGG
jgi:hypothetical protein